MEPPVGCIPPLLFIHRQEGKRERKGGRVSSDDKGDGYVYGVELIVFMEHIRRYAGTEGLTS
jgi:hypothetical protein